MPADAAASSPSVNDLQRRIEELIAENARLLTEACEVVEQQTATEEVLQAINKSPGDIRPVVDVMVNKAIALCGASHGGLMTYDGERIAAASLSNLPPGLRDFWRNPMPVDPQSYIGRVLSERQTVHVADLAESEIYRDRRPIAVAAVELGGIRSIVWVPLIGDHGPIGLFIVFWHSLLNCDTARLGPAEAECGTQHGVEHGLNVRGRAPDDLQNLAGRGLVFQRLGQVVGARKSIRSRPSKSRSCNRLRPRP